MRSARRPRSRSGWRHERRAGKKHEDQARRGRGGRTRPRCGRRCIRSRRGLSRAGGDDDHRRPYFPGRFEQPDYDRGDLPRPDREREFRWLGHFGDLDAAAKYLELAEDELHGELRDGKTLAEIAEEQGRRVAGLIQAIVDDVSKRLDQAVTDGRLTEEQADAITEGLEERITELVNGEPPFSVFEYPGRG